MRSGEAGRARGNAVQGSRILAPPPPGIADGWGGRGLFSPRQESPTMSRILSVPWLRGFGELGLAVMLVWLTLYLGQFLFR